MRKIILLLVISLVVFSGVVAAQAEGEWLFKAGYDFSGDLDVDPSDGGEETYDVDSGFSITGEYMLPAEGNIIFGAGASYQFDRDVDFGNPDNGNSKEAIRYTPIYVLGAYQMQESPIYFVGHLGYNLFSTEFETEDESGGMYYALGAAMDFENDYTAEILYTVNNSSIEVLDQDGETEELIEADLKYTKITINFGIKF